MRFWKLRLECATLSLPSPSAMDRYATDATAVKMDEDVVGGVM